MSYTDPNLPPQRPVHETRVTDNRGANTTAWVVAALVAVVAIIAVAFMVTNRDPATDETAVAAAMEQGRAEGMLAGAQSSLDSARIAAASAADATSAEASRAAAEARAAADSAARSAEDAASNASATITTPAPAPGEDQPPQ